MDAVKPVTSSEFIDQAPDAVTVSTDCTVECEFEYNTRTIKDVEFPSGDINGEIEEVPKENVSMVVSAVITDVHQGDDIPKTESELCENHASKDQNQDSINENVEAGLAGPLDQSPYFLSRSIQIQKENEIPVEATAAVSTEPVVKEIRDNLEAFQSRGLARRLQFEDVDTVISNQHDQGPPSSEGPVSPLDAPLTPIQSKQAETVLPQYPRSTNTTVKIPKRSGIGLHLNSIVSTVQAGSGAIIHVKSAQRYNVSIRGKKPTPITSSHLSDSLNSSSVFTIREDVSKSMDDDRCESRATLAVNSVTSLSNSIVKPSDNSVVLKPVDESTSSNKRIYSNIEIDGNSEEFRSSPKKKRKISSDPGDGDGDGDGDGCKRCNCKKSRCLKLYCDCFAAGMYCAGPCACQGCYNRPEYVDTVLETRQQIESRNPLAFAPKIVQHTIEPPTSSCGEDGTYSTPSSARHKRGCNCKKSMCLKKYCECYQANVGCSDGCGCEGCKNVYGRKGEKGAYKDVLHKEGANERADGLFIGKKMPSLNPQNLTPVTPEVQFSNQRKDESKAWINSERHFLSPGWNLTSVKPYAITPGSGRNSQAAGDVLDLVSSDQELSYDNSKDQSFHANDHYSSMSSFSWCGSPNTPTAPFSVSKPLKAVDFDGKLSHTAMEDDTPDILKDSSAPDNAVKVSSPNKKRVSPPHGPQREFVSSSMVGLRTGRKFILKAVSSFPPLTPCVDSRSTVAQQKNDPQNYTNNK